MSSLEEMQAQLNYEIAIYREQISMIKRETERISLTTVDLNNALRTVENLGKGKALVPIGGGAMVRGSITETTVLVPIGAQYMTEMGKEEAMSEIEKRIDATKRAVEKLTQEFEKIAKKLRAVSGRLQQIQKQSRISEQVEENIREDYI
jgi:prefoldin alpha subunit